MFDRRFLENARRTAFRRGIWYSALDGVERGILVLASKVVDGVRSVRLGVVIVKILAKLKHAMKSGFERHMESYGVEEAKKIAKQAAAIGNTGAEGWAYNFNFIRYLTFIYLNRPTGWGII